MRTTSLADAKSHLSELVDAAEHHHKRVVILRHGKPAAAIVPVDVAVPSRRHLSPVKDAEKSIMAFISEFSAAEPEASAVQDLLAGKCI